MKQFSLVRGTGINSRFIHFSSNSDRREYLENKKDGYEWRIPTQYDRDYNRRCKNTKVGRKMKRGL
jgi:hypothetical protein